MKLVNAILRPHLVDDVRTALGTYGIHGMTLSQVTGYGTELWRTETYRGRTFHDESVSAARIECVVADADVEDVVRVILRSAGSAASGAGKIWVLPVASLTRVRTGERGLDAL
ncbi:P-II family nitrogen regulator [Frankia sp. AiPs1]|uniref:P-II family nitrogen regulator n=1 Tax=Frankia sp. AiPs1 TaxID=573493 RepID=UPI002043B810|nr:P-II family nitrogen regulator [Frankia sp. AiPs1]MCM3922958.1 P-II family nitrogen regulator [Frankia sp. AiPs1]